MSTIGLMRVVEAAGFQFLRDERGWALYDTDTRAEVGGTRRDAMGDSIWAAAELLEVSDG